MEQSSVTTGNARERAGRRASFFGIGLNFLLAVCKLLVGYFTGLVSVLADGFNNLSDCGSSAVSLVSFRIAAKPADKEHPYGHRRAEYVATMLISCIVLLLAFELLRESAGKLIEGEVSRGGLLVYLLLGASILVKGGMFVYYRLVASRIDSDALRAAAVDSACDCIATLAALIGVLISEYAHVPADGWAGIVVSLFIAWQGVGLLRETSSKLLGQAPDPALIEAIKTRILSGHGVLGMHDLRVYGYGPGKYFASVHVEVDARVPVLEAHEIVDAVERDFAEHTEVELTGHLDPIVTDDARTNALRARIAEKLSALDPAWTMHDFRVVWGEQITKVLFDLAVPFACTRTEKEILSAVTEAVRREGPFEPNVTVERE